MDLLENYPLLVGILVVLSLFFTVILFFNKNADLKRRLFVPLIIFSGIMFIGLAWVMGHDLKFMLIFVPATALICYMNIRVTKFCDGCGKTIINPNFLTPPKFCINCGEPLE